MCCKELATEFFACVAVNAEHAKRTTPLLKDFDTVFKTSHFMTGAARDVFVQAERCRGSSRDTDLAN